MLRAGGEERLSQFVPIEDHAPKPRRIPSRSWRELIKHDHA